MKFLTNIIKKKNSNKYKFLCLVLLFALISRLFFYSKKKTVIVFNRNKEIHWGFPISRPSAPRMRNF